MASTERKKAAECWFFPIQRLLCITYRLFVVYDLTEVRFQSGSAYQTTIDIRLSEKLRSGSCVYRSTVLDTDSFCGCLIVDLSDAFTDLSANFLSLLGSSGFSGSDCPDRLVSDNSFFCLISSQSLETDLNLLAPSPSFITAPLP